MSDLVIERCDPREREQEIRELFARNGSPQFDGVFERAYRSRAECGLTSWLGLRGGTAVMHIAVNPLPFRSGERRVMGGVLGDLMVDQSHRDFWAPVRLLRTMVADVKRDGRIQFLITTTTTEATSVFKAGGFKPFGQIRRFVLPLRSLYLTYSRLRSGAARRTAAESAFEETALPDLVPSWESADLWRPEVDRAYFSGRLGREEYVDGQWVAIGGDGRAPALALLSRNRELGEVGLADAFWHDDAGLFDLLSAAARSARARRFPRLSISTLDGGRASRGLLRAGFFARSIRSDLLLHQLGGTELPPADDWFLTSFAMSGW